MLSKIIENLSFWFRKFGNLFFQPQCPVCFDENETNNICAKCFSQVIFLQEACMKCQTPFDYIVPDMEICARCQELAETIDLKSYDKMFCALQYNELVKNLIVRFKNQQDFSLAKLFAKWLFAKYNNANLNLQNVVIVPIPLYKTRLVQRGYNQSMLIAKEFAKLVNLPCINLLKRTRDTNTQATKTIQERHENVKGAFAVDIRYKDFIKGKNILLIDDVITTGATMFECAKALKNANSVQLLAVARRLRKAREIVDLSKEFVE